jgi:hypothetical protein
MGLLQNNEQANRTSGTEESPRTVRNLPGSASDSVAGTRLVPREVRVLSFEEFCASKSEFKNATQDENPNVSEDGANGFLYPGCLVIEDVTHWNHESGKYYLILERSEYVTDDLAALEQKLYEFAIDSGAVHAPETAQTPAPTAAESPGEKTFLLRMSGEYSLTVKAFTEEQAIAKGETTNTSEWDVSWSSIEAEEA